MRPNSRTLSFFNQTLTFLSSGRSQESCACKLGSCTEFALGSGMPKKSSATIYNTFAFVLSFTNYVFGHHLSEGQLGQAAGTGQRSYDIPITTIGASKLGHDHQKDISATSIPIAGISGTADMYVPVYPHPSSHLLLTPNLQSLHNSHNCWREDFLTQPWCAPQRH